jgi:hypothetical protein
VLGALTFGGGHAASGAIQTYVASGSMSVDISSLSSPQHLLLGLLDPLASGGGFDTLHFQMMREDLSVIDVNFASLAAALAYFNDRTIDLGPIGQDVAGTLDLSWRLDIRSTSGDGFLTTFIIGNATSGSAVPEPTALLILTIPLLRLISSLNAAGAMMRMSGMYSTMLHSVITTIRSTWRAASFFIGMAWIQRPKPMPTPMAMMLAAAGAK